MMMMMMEGEHHGEEKRTGKRERDTGAQPGI
jgi:hypothetical protein